MGIPLSKLLEGIGNAVQNANLAIEQYAAAEYLKQGYAEMKDEQKTDGDRLYEPITYMLNISTASGKRKIQVPATVLMHHSSLQLEQVDVKLRFVMEGGDESEIEVKIKEAENREETGLVSELSMQFKTAPLSEGMARIENRHIQML